MAGLRLWRGCGSPGWGERSGRGSGSRLPRLGCTGGTELPEDVRQMGRGWRPEHIEALVHSLGTTAIWPEDYDALAAQRADILVTHEAPSSHPAGKAALDALARAMGARLIVHGHHHVNYLAAAGGWVAGAGGGGGLGRDGDGRGAVGGRGAAASDGFSGGMGAGR